MQNAEKLQARIDALEWYHDDGMNMPSVNVKILGRIKDIDEIAEALPASEYKAEAVSHVKSIDETEFGSYFWRACEVESEYTKDVLFDGVAFNEDEPEMKHVKTLSPYKDRSGNYGRTGGHFCIRISRDDLEQYITDAEEYPEDAEDSLSTLSGMLDAIEWGLEYADSIAKGVPDTIADMIENDLIDEIAGLEEKAKERATPRYKIDRLREWEKTLTDKERDAIARNVKSIEKQLSTLSGD